MHLPPWSAPPQALTLAPQDLHVWLVLLDREPAALGPDAAVLSADEVERARRFHFERDSRRFVAAHAALRTILAGYLATDPRALRFVTTEYGKPALVADPAHRMADLAFNLSHSASLGLVAVARGRRVGVDIELVRPELADGSVAEKFFSPDEVRELRSLPPPEQARAFFACWTRKEAFVKARGEGLSLPLDSFDVTLRPGVPATILHTRPDPAEAVRWSLLELPVDPFPAYQAAAALEGPPGEVHRFRFLKNN